MISRELVGLMGGTISLDSELGRGTCVSFWMPLNEASSSVEERRIILRPRKDSRGAPKRLHNDTKAENLMNYCMQKLADGQIRIPREGLP